MSWLHCTLLASLTLTRTRPASPSSCSEVSRAAAEARQTALLYAHRCNLRDVAVAVAGAAPGLGPANVIPDLVLPSHIVVPRCQGGVLTWHSLLFVMFNMFIETILGLNIHSSIHLLCFKVTI